MAQNSFVRYTIAGVFAAVLDYGIFTVVLAALSKSMPVMARAVANGAGMVAGAVFAFLVNRTWTFRAHGNLQRQAVQYTILLVVNFFLSSGLIYWLGHTTSLSPALCKGIAIVFIFLWNYLVNRFVIFRRVKEASSE